MHHGYGGLVRITAQIVVEGAQLSHQEHTLIDYGARGEGAYVGVLRALLELPAADIEPAVEGQALLTLLWSLYEALLDARHVLDGHLPQDLRVYGDRAPAHQL